MRVAPGPGGVSCSSSSSYITGLTARESESSAFIDVVGPVVHYTSLSVTLPGFSLPPFDTPVTRVAPTPPTAPARSQTNAMLRAGEIISGDRTNGGKAGASRKIKAGGSVGPAIGVPKRSETSGAEI